MVLFVLRNNQLSASKAVILCHALTVNTTLRELGQYHTCLAQGPDQGLEGNDTDQQLLNITSSRKRKFFVKVLQDLVEYCKRGKCKYS